MSPGSLRNILITVTRIPVTCCHTCFGMAASVLALDYPLGLESFFPTSLWYHFTNGSDFFLNLHADWSDPWKCLSWLCCHKQILNLFVRGDLALSWHLIVPLAKFHDYSKILSITILSIYLYYQACRKLVILTVSPKLNLCGWVPVYILIYICTHVKINQTLLNYVSIIAKYCWLTALLR